MVLEALREEPSVSVRLNPFKKVEELYEGCRKVPWSPYGRFLRERPTFTLDPLFHAGAYYVQDSSAMFVGYVLRQVIERFGGARILDLCAAPGGKTTDIAASLREKYGDGFCLVANEVDRQRASVLRENMVRWGDPNVVICSKDPKGFGAFPGSFDVIVADVPCSGEGMFRKDRQAVEQWSRESVALCAARQRRIIADVWPALREGGVLIYSTCTFNVYENDCNLRWIRENLGAEKIEMEVPEGVIETGEGCLLAPGFVPGEGQFCGCIRKPQNCHLPPNPLPLPPSGEGEAEPKGSVAFGVSRSNQGASAEPSRKPQNCHLPPMVSGLLEGEGKKSTIEEKEAMHAEAMSINGGRWPRVEVDRERALKFLHGDSVVLPDAPRGVVAVCYRGLALGLVKNIGSRCNNLLPKNLRIRMDI